MDGEMNDERRAEVKEDEQDVHGHMILARERAKRAEEAWEPIYRRVREDVEFLSGKQWPDEVLDTRKGRVSLTINQLPKYVRQVLGDGKQNRIQIKVRPVEGDVNSKIPNLAGSKDYTYAEVMEGIVRNIEALSRAELAYDNALKHAVEGGIGWLRVAKRYARPDGFEQELVIRPVRNVYSVLFDPDAMTSDEPNFTGGKYCFVHIELPRKEAERQFKQVADVDYLPVEARPWWGTQDTVRVAEYFYIEEQPQVYVQLSDGAVMTETDATAVAEQLAAKGVTVVARRDGIERQLFWELIDGVRVLEGPIKLDGGYIPLVPVCGPDAQVDGQVSYESLIRHSHDAQRMYNYWRSAATEAVALAPKAPWLADAASVAGYEKGYDDATEEPVALLKYKHREGVPKPERVQSAYNPAAEIQQALHANDDVKGTLGLFDASIGRQSNETSGKAILARQREGDVGTFSWHDALAKAVEHVGRIITDLVPRVYDTERVMRIKTATDGEDFVRINYPIDGEGLVRADLGAQRYDVTVATGPSMTTQRLEAAESMMGFVQAIAPGAPQAVQAIMDKVALAMDWPGADEIAKRLRKLVPPELLDPSEIEDQPPPPPPDPAAAAQAQVDQTESEAKLISAQADLISAQAKLAEAQNLAPERIKDLVAEAIADLLRPNQLPNA